MDGGLPWFRLSTSPRVPQNPQGRLAVDGIAHIKAFTVSFKAASRYLTPTVSKPWLGAENCTPQVGHLPIVGGRLVEVPVYLVDDYLRN